MTRAIGARIDGALDHEAGLRQVARAMREVPDMTTRVVGIARQTGWLVNHARPGAVASGKIHQPIQGHAGFPDLALVHQTVPVAVIAELKRWGYGAKSHPTPDQDRWLRAYGATPGVLALCWDTLDLVAGRVAALLADPAECVRLAALPYQPKDR